MSERERERKGGRQEVGVESVFASNFFLLESFIVHNEAEIVTLVR